MSIEQQNRLIAEFMGYCYDESMRVFRVSGSLQRVWDNLDYHKEWRLLMPVIEKISRIPLIGAESPRDVCYPVTFNMPDDNGKPMFRFCGFGLHKGDTLINAAYDAVVEVIEFVNTNPTTNDTNK